jgi:hypothetical protein
MVLYDGGEATQQFQNAVCAFLPQLCPPAAGAGGSGPDAGTPAAACPRLLQVNPALNNYNPINAQYANAGPGGSTPTALALDAAYKLVPAQQQIPDQNVGPAYVILCTDGEPNGCQDPSAWASGGLQTDYQGPINEVTEAANSGIKTFVVGIAVNAQAQAHLEDLARIGNTGSPAFSPASKDELVQRLTEIVGGAIGCEVTLNGTVTVGQECTGEVQLNGQPLACNGPDGWILKDASHIELQGQSCRSFMNDPNAVLHAGFPCGVFVIE